MPKITTKKITKASATAEPVESKELVIAKRTVPTLVSQATAIETISEENKKDASEILSQLNQWNDRVVADRETLTVPLNALLKNIRARYSPIETMLKTNIEGLRGKLGRYQTEATRLAREEEAKIAARVGDGKGHLKVETAVKKMDEIAKPSETVAADSGSLSFREDKVLKIVDAKLIPDEFYDLNERRALDALKAGRAVPGCEIELVQVPINRR